MNVRLTAERGTETGPPRYRVTRGNRDEVQFLGIVEAVQMIPGLARMWQARANGLVLIDDDGRALRWTTRHEAVAALVARAD